MGGCVLPVGRLVAAAVGEASLPRDGLPSMLRAGSGVARLRGICGVACAREVRGVVRTVEAGAGTFPAGLARLDGLAGLDRLAGVDGSVSLDGAVVLLNLVVAVVAAVSTCAAGVDGCIVLAGEGREPDAAEVGARVRSGAGGFDPAVVDTLVAGVLGGVAGEMSRVRWPPAVDD